MIGFRSSVNTVKQIFNCRCCVKAGDVITMTMHLLGVSFAAALAYLTNEQKAVLDLKPAPATAKAAATDDERSRTRRAREIWHASVDPRGTIVELYLNSRALHLDADLAGAALRFHPHCPWRESPTEPTIFVPAMIAVMRSLVTDKVTAVSRRRLTAQGEKVGKPKFFGLASGAAVKLDRDDAVLESITAGEGVETTMTARQLGLRPAWALGSSGALANFPVLAGIEYLTLLAEHGDASARAIQACGERWHSAGREVLINRPRFGTDLNDAWKMRGVQ
jgi:putative DNA primase/helicase